jgi:hypothetical protein
MEHYTEARKQQYIVKEDQPMSGENDFDFLLGTWTIRNRRRTNPFEKEGIWEEFQAKQTGVKYLDGKVQFEFFEGTMPNGVIRKGITIRNYDPRTEQWSIRWLDNINPLDFGALKGSFQNEIGLFYEEITSPLDGRPLRCRFTWDNLSATTARWQQAFSYDKGETWETNWIAEFTK